MAQWKKWENPLGRYKVYWKDIQKLPEVNKGLNAFMEEKVVPAWKSHSPKGKRKRKRDSYIDSIAVTKKSTDKGRGVVGAESEHAHIVEFGGGLTPEYAPAEKTAKQFGGYAHDKPGTE